MTESLKEGILLALIPILLGELKFKKIQHGLSVLFKWIKSVWSFLRDRLKNKQPIIDKLQVENKELQEKYRELSIEYNRLIKELNSEKAKNISKPPELKTYHYDLRNYEDMDWKITLRYRLDKDNKPLDHIDAVVEDPYCPHCGTSLSFNDRYDEFGWSALWFNCPKKY